MYEDDAILIGTNIIEITQLKAYLDTTFKIKDLQKLHYLLRLEILDTIGGVLVSQRKFILDTLKKYNFLDCVALSFPLNPTIKLKAKEREPLLDLTYYGKLIGKLNFLTNTRLDITFSVQQLSQYMQDPRTTYLKATFHLLSFLKRDPTLGIRFSRDPDCTVKAFCDSD